MFPEVFDLLKIHTLKAVSMTMKKVKSYFHLRSSNLLTAGNYINIFFKIFHTDEHIQKHVLYNLSLIKVKVLCALSLSLIYLVKYL